MEMFLFYIWKFFAGLFILSMIPVGVFLVMFVMSSGKRGWREMHKDKDLAQRMDNAKGIWK